MKWNIVFQVPYVLHIDFKEDLGPLLYYVRLALTET